MDDRIAAIFAELNDALLALPGVFSTAQWGGRAYKLPRGGSASAKPKLLAFMLLADEGEAVSVSFKLPPERAAALVERHAWLAPHSFRTLAPSGWVSATITNKRTAGPLLHLVTESRSLYPTEIIEPISTPAKTGSDPVARHIDVVMREAVESGWTPPGSEAFGS